MSAWDHRTWTLTPRALYGFNSWQLHRITGRSYHEEATKPSAGCADAEHHWLGHILGMPADRLVRRAVLALGQRVGPPYHPGSLLMDMPLPIHELVLEPPTTENGYELADPSPPYRKAPKGGNSNSSSSPDMTTDTRLHHQCTTCDPPEETVIPRPYTAHARDQGGATYSGGSYVGR